MRSRARPFARRLKPAEAAEPRARRRVSTAGFAGVIALVGLLFARCDRRPVGRGHDGASGPIVRRSPERTVEVRWVFADLPDHVPAGAEIAVTVAFKNTAIRTLSPGNLAIAYHWQDAATPPRVVIWEGIRSPISVPVASGGIFTSDNVRVKAPASPGTYTIAFDIVREGVAWFSNLGSPTLDRRVEVE